MAALNRKRRRLEKAVGARACQKAQAHRRKTAQAGAIITGVGKVMLSPCPSAPPNLAAIRNRARTQVKSAARGTLT